MKINKKQFLTIAMLAINLVSEAQTAEFEGVTYIE